MKQIRETHEISHQQGDVRREEPQAIVGKRPVEVRDGSEEWKLVVQREAREARRQ